MIKNKLDFKLVNIAILAFIFFLLYHTGNLWLGIFAKFMKIFLPFFFAFVVAYALYPITLALQKKKIPKGISIFIVIAGVVGILALLISMVVPVLYEQLGSLFNGIIVFLKELSTGYDLNLGELQSTLNAGFNNIIATFSKYVSDGAVNIIGTSINALSTIVISFSAAIYILIDMDNIRNWVKKFLKKRSKKLFRYVQLIDKEMHNYLVGFTKIAIISLFEYYFAYAIIGHPNALLLGFLAAIAGLIPYFGGIINNVVAAITAFVISPTLFIWTLVIFFLLSSLDGYVINPLVYGKTNKVHPLVVILSVFMGGILWGVLGIILSLPIAIIIITTYKFFEEDITDKIEDIKKNKETV